MAGDPPTGGDGTSGRSRRSVLASIGVGLGSIAVASTGVRGQQSPTDAGGGAQIQQRAIVPRIGQPFRGEYVGQFVLFTDPTPDDDVTPEIVGTCDFADWSPAETRGYQGLLLDRVTDDSKGVEIPMYLNQNRPRVDVGEAFIVNRVESCGEDFLGMELEAVPIESFEPAYDTDVNPLVGEEPGPGVSPADGGETAAPGQPGMGVVATALGVGGAALLRRLLDRSEE